MPEITSKRRNAPPAAKKRVAAANKHFGGKGDGATGARQMDLGVGDVHVPGAAKARRRGKTLHVRADLAAGGSLHVRHMRDEETLLVLDGSEIDANDASITMAIGAAVNGAPPRVWIQLAKTGRFAGHPSGAFELNAKVFGEIIANFRHDAKPIPIDYEHASEMPATEGSIPTSGAPAQGWIYDMKIDGGNLYGLVEWGAQAREQIRSGAYKFFSPAIRFNSKDRVTGQPIGARMSSGAMTNSPFLTHLQPLAAKDTSPMIAAADRAMRIAPMNMAACRSALRLDDLASPAECADKLGRLREVYASAPHASATYQGVDLSSYTTALQSLCGLPSSATVSDLLDLVQEMIEEAMEEHVEQYHEGQEPADAADMDDGGDDDEGGADMRAAADTQTQSQATTATNKEAAMADAETTKKLSDLETEKTSWTTERTTLMSERDAATAKNAGLELELKSALADVATKSEQLKKLSDEAEARLTADRAARVEEAFGTYKDAKRLTDGDKDQMRVYLMSNEEGFEKLYPKVDADKRHLLSRIAGDGTDKTKVQTLADGSVATFSMSDLANQLIEKGWDVDKAQLEAERVCKQFARS